MKSSIQMVVQMNTAVQTKLVTLLKPHFWLLVCLSADVGKSTFAMWKVVYEWQYIMYRSAVCMKVRTACILNIEVKRDKTVHL
jgi:hypothetical protein